MNMSARYRMIVRLPKLARNLAGLTLMAWRIELPKMTQHYIQLQPSLRIVKWRRNAAEFHGNVAADRGINGHIEIRSSAAPLWWAKQRQSIYDAKFHVAVSYIIGKLGRRHRTDANSLQDLDGAHIIFSMSLRG